MNIEFGESILDGRVVWQDIISNGKIIGALYQKSSGSLNEPIVWHQCLISSDLLYTIPKDEYDRFRESEDDGFDFVICYDLDKFTCLVTKYLS